MQEPNIEIIHHRGKDPGQYLDLWKWLPEDAAKTKDKVWTIASFFYTLLGAMLGYAAKDILVNDTKPYSIEFAQPALVGTVAVIGCLLSGYAMYMLREYGKHVRSRYNMADYIRFRIDGLGEIWCYGNAIRIAEERKQRSTKDNSIPPVVKRLIVIMSFFFAIIFWIVYTQLNAMII